MGTAYPPALAGLVVGGWRLDEPGRAPAALPAPGVEIARSSSSWYDSLEVRPGGGAWAGFDGALASLTGTAPAGVRRGRSTFMLQNGSHALEDYALTLARGDSIKDAGVDVSSGTLGAESGFESLGRHLWAARARVTRGRQSLAGSFSQRGEAARLEDDEEEAASGQSGTLAWSYRGRDLLWRLGYERGWDRHESFGGPLLASTREAQETRVAGEAICSQGGRELAARVEWTDAKVERTGDDAFDRRAGSVWAAVRGTAPLAGGRLELAVGLGRHDAAKRVEAVPSATFRLRSSGTNLTASVERMVTPVWSDVPAGADPFLQRAWVASIRAAAADTQGWRARGSVRAGRVYARALAEPLPLEDLWLRAGLRPDLGPYDFALAEGGLVRDARFAEAGVEGFGLARRGIALPVGAVRAARTD
ncbi:MAG TPA: hypothetical protein VMS88_04470, partial [Terriglobales bacterium]|nr:hypothetical protein [Terriglobales bacterium]